MNMKWLNMKLSMREWCGWEGETVSVTFGQCSLVLWWWRGRGLLTVHFLGRAQWSSVELSRAY